MLERKLKFLSLGGLEEIGLNCYLYGVEENNITKYLMADLGIGFKDYKFKFLNTFIPDISFLKEKNNILEGILITHGHEDHIGAISYHYNDIKGIPIYTTPFTADLIRNKLKRIDTQPNIIEIEQGIEYSLKSFKFTFLPVDHSIPNSTMVLIKMDDESLIHSGDFKININKFNPSEVKKYLTEPVKYLFCDSTNSLRKEATQDESSIIPDLSKLINEATESIWITLFSSNVERLANIIKIAKENNKKVVLLGASVANYYMMGKKYNIIIDSNTVINLEESAQFARKDLLYIITGSQGEDKSFLYNILFQQGKSLRIKKNDTVIFSSKIIPGNELNVSKIYNALAEIEVNIFTAYDYNIHVSGHPSIEELKLFYNTINPNIVIPIHGEVLHIKFQQKLAKQLGFKSYTFKNGEIIQLNKDIPEIIQKIEFKKIHREGGRNILLNSDIFKQRKKIMFEGVISAFLVIKSNKKLQDLKLNIVGLLNDDEKKSFTDNISKTIEKLLVSSSKNDLSNINYIEEKVKSIIKKLFINSIQKKPLIYINIYRI